jgi:hypothetical protein
VHYPGSFVLSRWLDQHPVLAGVMGCILPAGYDSSAEVARVGAGSTGPDWSWSS